MTKTPNDNQNVVIRVSGLKKNFGDLTAVDGISFEVHQGEIFGFLGPNGAGKTTSINMICGLIEPSAGEIIFFENRNLSRRDIKSRIGICPQENLCWPKLTCLEQLRFMGEMYGMDGKFAKTRAKALLEWMGLAEKTRVVAWKLSGGMKRRLNICLALVHDPDILILDEPEAGLDPQSRILVRNFIKNLAKDKTIILTTHNMDEADRLAHRVAIIDYGKLLLVDTPHNLKKSIGEGDMLEIVLGKNRNDITSAENTEGTGQAAPAVSAGSTAEEPTEALGKLVNSLLEICGQVTLNNENLLLRSRNLLEQIPGITLRIHANGYKIEAMTMRENTLEDVFIHLTGRKLRQ